MNCFFNLALNRLNEFQKYFETKKNLPALRPSSFRFLLRFPGELESQWNKYRYLQWPLDVVNIDHCLEEHRLSVVAYHRSRTLSLPKEYSLLIFTRSSLPFHRIIHNYSASMTLKLKQTSSTSSIEWTCDYFDNSEQIFEVLSKFGTIKKLKIGSWTGTKLQKVCESLITQTQFGKDYSKSLCTHLNQPFSHIIDTHGSQQLLSELSNN